MKKILLPIAILIAILFSSCDTNPIITTGTLELVSVSPTTGYVDGTPIEMTIVVDYTLIGSDEGEIKILFNDGAEVDTFYSKASKRVSEGSGTETFVVTVTPKDWDIAGDFLMRSYIIQYPYPDPYELLDDVAVRITF